MINEMERSTSQLTATGVVDPKDVDILLGEITIMHSRYHLYLRFIRRRVTNDLEVESVLVEVKGKLLVYCYTNFIISTKQSYKWEKFVCTVII